MTKSSRIIATVSSVTTMILLFAPTTFAEGPRNISASFGLNQSLTNHVDQAEQETELNNQRILDFRTKLASREALLRDRLLKLKDQNRAQIAQRASENMNKVNMLRTDTMNKHLDILAAILAKVVTQASGSATSSASTQAIASASASIASARAIVATQAQRDYTIAAVSDGTLQSELKAKRDQLFKDLTAARLAVLGAKDAVIAAIQSVKGQKGQN